MIVRWHWSLLVGLGACGDDTTTPDTIAGEVTVTRDVAGEAEAGPTVACAEVVIDDVELGAGRRLTIPTHGATITAPLPTGLERLAGDDFVVQADYTTHGTLAIPVTATCASGERAFEWHVTLRPMTWTQAPSWTDATGPSAREHTLFWIDPRTPGVMTLHGGLLYEPAQGTNSDDMWRLDLDTLAWKRFTPTGTSPLQAITRAFPAPDGNGFWMHGGDVRGNPVASIVAFDGTGWQASTINDGPAVELHATVYDAPRSRVVSVLGVRKNFTLSTAVAAADLLSGVWQELATANAGPDPRYGFAYGLQGDRLVVVSGAREPTATDPVNAAPDVWALELAEQPPRWVELTPTDPGHRFRNAAFAYDPESERLFIFGGTADGATAVAGLSILDLRRGREAWIHLDADAYSNAAPPDRASCTGSWDPKRHRFMVGFGNSQAGLFTDLWTLSL